jgi:hypothetical protein
MYLDEGLHFAPPRQLLLAHAPSDFEWVPLNPGHDCMRIWPFLGPFVQLLDHYNLLPRLPALQNNGDLT